jgi:hypothetical protein
MKLNSKQNKDGGNKIAHFLDEQDNPSRKSP